VVNSVLDDDYLAVKNLLVAIQSELHIICANLADQSEREDKPEIQPRHIEALEQHCDEFDEKIPELKKFIIPGGGYEASLMHQARTVCRRAERRAVSASSDYAVNPDVIRYLNRLSDLLFILARYLNYQEEIAELHPDYSK
jgi:cob(I)alamin adenosyltransferase